jgi:hypothetical protein
LEGGDLRIDALVVVGLDGSGIILGTDESDGGTVLAFLERTSTRRECALGRWPWWNLSAA